MNTLAFVLLVSSGSMLGVIGCRDSGSSHSFNNPADPDNQPKAAPDRNSSVIPVTISTTSTATGTATSSSAGISIPSKPAGSSTSATSTQTAACLTGTCAPPSGTVFDFANTFSITPTGCSGVSQVNMFDTGSGLLFFLRANCGMRYGIYSFTTSYSGGSMSSLNNIASDCLTTAGAPLYTVAPGASGYLAAYECQQSTSSFTTSVVPVSASGVAGTPSLYETNSSSTRHSLAWNGVANAFGIAGYNKFQRLTAAGATVAGPIASGSANARFTMVSGGTWYIVSQQNDGTYCSSVNSSGALQCNAVRIDGGGALSVLPGPSNLTFAIDPYISINVISSSDCTSSNVADMIRTSNSLHSMLSTVALAGNYAAVAFSSSLNTANALVVATLDQSKLNVPSEASVTSYSTSLGGAKLAVVQNKLYLAYDKDGGGYVSYSTQTVQ